MGLLKYSCPLSSLYSLSKCRRWWKYELPWWWWFARVKIRNQWQVTSGKWWKPLATSHSLLVFLQIIRDIVPFCQNKLIFSLHHYLLFVVDKMPNGIDLDFIHHKKNILCYRSTVNLLRSKTALLFFLCSSFFFHREFGGDVFEIYLIINS